MDWNIIWLIVSGIILFLFSIKKFSRQVQRVSGKRFNYFLRKLTKTPFRGTLVGAGITSLVQSSSATTIILVGFVNAGLISFGNSLGVIFGANIGTTITTQLVALKLTSIAPFFIIAGFFIEIFGKKYRMAGRPIFYFGLVFFSLSLISSYTGPLSESPEIVSILSQTSNIFMALLVGFILTVIFQSSSITSGLVVVLVGASLLNFDQAIGIIFGANIGTTTTAIFASLGLNDNAKKTAVAHFLFNVLGVLIFLPFIGIFSEFIHLIGGTNQMQVANAHLIFNIILTLIFLILINPFEKLTLKVFELLNKIKLKK